MSGKPEDRQQQDPRDAELARLREELRTAEEAQRRAAFLAEASTLLDASLDYPSTLASLACLSVPRIGDWCIIDLVSEFAPDGQPLSVRRVTAIHADPAKAEATRELVRRYPPELANPRGSVQVMVSGRPAFFPQLAEADLQAIPDPRQRELLWHLGACSYMCVPFLCRGRTLGAITFLRGDRTPPFERDDLALAEDLAHRAALAIDTAQLYHLAQQGK